MKTFTITTDNDITFNLKLLFKYDTYGLNDSLTHTGDEPLIEFYDSRYNHSPLGQFVSRYYTSTLLEHDDNYGLALDGNSKEWSIDKKSMQSIKEFISSSLSEINSNKSSKLKFK